jgi:hypothetical protein
MIVKKSFGGDDGEQRNFQPAGVDAHATHMGWKGQEQQDRLHGDPRDDWWIQCVPRRHVSLNAATLPTHSTSLMKQTAHPGL